MVTSREGVLLIIGFLALFTHAWFRKNEPKSLLRLLAFWTAVVLPSSYALLLHVGSSFQAFTLASTSFTTTLLLSISLYRLSPLHPLSRYPGPWQCKLTKLWGAYIAWGGKPYVYYKRLHDQYGPVVRIGPNELSVVDADLIPNVLGASGMPKGPMWSGRRILPSKNWNRNNSLTSVRDLRRHAELRKPWNTAFKPSSIAEYEGMLIARAEQMIRCLKAFCTRDGPSAIDLALWINFFTFDFMGDLAFGGVYSLMRDGDTQQVLLKMKRGVFMPSISQHIPWILGTLHAISFVSADTRAFGMFGIEQAKKRAAMQDNLTRKDLFYHLLEDAKMPVLTKLVSSALLAIVAGSDTTSSALANICYYLIRYPDYLHRLREELDATFKPSEPNETIEINALASLPLLDAIINETLRLQPPIPTSLQRAPADGSGGKALSPDMYILEGTAVQISPWVIHRCPRYFYPDPDKFWPDRWISGDPSIILDKSAFIPFSTGPANCPGRPLAIIELRYVTCLLVRTFDMSFEPDYDVAQWEESLEDRFVMLKGELPVKLALREVGKKSD
ncbi:hypothetical protein CVT26_013882 [Gymnopilus dilepis]|uniref:Cytochrome P450 n=1 Tax=Gymnopilus dilepis TaxID=231916 RepID=A0A409Y6A7_9AGAR|nr:hypothetical protein CVT26_013882 [Gymnopilus dilepis]